MGAANQMQTNLRQIPSVTNDGRGATKFGFREVALNGSSNWMLSDQQAAVNFRLRSSASQYQSDWHVAGDPTLLIILKGIIVIELRDGSTRQFTAGEMFVAEDYLLEGAEFDHLSGHRARVLGEGTFEALHLKLAKR